MEPLVSRTGHDFMKNLPESRKVLNRYYEALGYNVVTPESTNSSIRRAQSSDSHTPANIRKSK